MKHLYSHIFLFIFFLLQVQAEQEKQFGNSLFYDPYNSKEVIDILSSSSPKAFIPISNQTAFVHQRNGFYWLKLVPAVEPSSIQTHWVYINSSNIDSAEVFFVQPKHGLEHYDYSQLSNFSIQAGIKHCIAFPFYPAGKGNLVIYVKFRIKQAGFITPTIVKEFEFNDIQKEKSQIIGFVTAIAFFSILILTFYARKSETATSDCMSLSFFIGWTSLLLYFGIENPLSTFLGHYENQTLTSLIALTLVAQSAFFYYSLKPIVLFEKYRNLNLMFLFGFVLLSVVPWIQGIYFSLNWVLCSGIAFLGFSTYISARLALKRLKPAKNLLFASGSMLILVSVFAFASFDQTPFSILPLGVDNLLLNSIVFMHLVQFVGLVYSIHNKQTKSLRFFQESYKEIRNIKNMLTHENLQFQKVIGLHELKTTESHQRFESTLKHIDHQKSIIEEKNKDIMDGIRYAHRIQNSLLSHREKMKEQLPSSFVLFQPKDIVSGDFYFCSPLQQTKEKNAQKVLLAVIDCAGHGVSGALLAVIGNLMLSNIVAEGRIESPSEILYELDSRLNQIIGNQQSEYPLNHGMDISLCIIDKTEKQLVYSGARRPLMLFQKGTLHEIKGSKSSVGVNLTSTGKVFFDTDISYEQGDTFYLFTDGYVDQFAEKGGKKFMVSQFRELLTEIQCLRPEQQEKKLENAINLWKGIDKQTDDILVMGVQV